MKMRIYLVPVLGLVGFGTGFCMTPLWSGSVDTGNWAKCVDICAEAFDGAAEGSVVTVDFNVTESYGKLELNTADFDLLDAQKTLTGLNGMGEFSAAATTTSATLSARDVRLLQQKGMKLTGEYLHITNVSMEEPPENPPMPPNEPEFPARLYVASTGAIDMAPVEMTKVGDSYYGDNVIFTEAAEFILTTVDSPSWATVNSRRRFGAQTASARLADGIPVTVVDIREPGIDANSWSIEAGPWSLTADLGTMTLTATKIPSSLVTTDADMEKTATVHYTISGVATAKPTLPGVYIVRLPDGNVKKEIIR